MAPDRLLKLLKNLPDPQQTQMDVFLSLKGPAGHARIFFDFRLLVFFDRAKRCR